jgi:hypothetical protein
MNKLQEKARKKFQKLFYNSYQKGRPERGIKHEDLEHEERLNGKYKGKFID